MASEPLDCRRMKLRMQRTLHFGRQHPKFVNLPLSEFVVNYFDKVSPYDYMMPETSTGISRRCYADPCVLIVALVYLDRLRNSEKEFFECSNPAHLYVAALMLASKFLNDYDSDEYAGSEDWAYAANMDVGHITALEWEFAAKLNWNCFVRREVFQAYLENVERHVASDFVSKYRIGSYNELALLCDAIQRASYFEALQLLLGTLGLSTLIYTMSVASMVLVPLFLESLRGMSCLPSSNTTTTFPATLPHFPPSRVSESPFCDRDDGFEDEEQRLNDIQVLLDGLNMKEACASSLHKRRAFSKTIIEKEKSHDQAGKEHADMWLSSTTFPSREYPSVDLIIPSLSMAPRLLIPFGAKLTHFDSPAVLYFSNYSVF